MEAERTGFHTIEEPHPTKLVEGGVRIVDACRIATEMTD
jgi:hypothetical protein